jgi:hypothetical protein
MYHFTRFCKLLYEFASGGQFVVPPMLISHFEIMYPSKKNKHNANSIIIVGCNLAFMSVSYMLLGPQPVLQSPCHYSSSAASCLPNPIHCTDQCVWSAVHPRAGVGLARAHFLLFLVGYDFFLNLKMVQILKKFRSIFLKISNLFKCYILKMFTFWKSLYF